MIKITGRTISQGITRDGKKTLREYAESTAICELDPKDLEKLGIKDSNPIKIETSHGAVTVRAVVSTRAPQGSPSFRWDRGQMKSQALILMVLEYHRLRVYWLKLKQLLMKSV